MSIDKLRNCPRCGDLFVANSREVCPNCVQKETQELEACIQFLKKKENRQASMQEVSEGTGVSIDQITKFIMDRRLSAENNPNLGYPCESCGKMIQSAKFCEPCKEDWEQSIQAQKDKSSQSTSTFFTHNKKK
jgi:flagellar operon protein (TIGR03826 family)